MATGRKGHEADVFEKRAAWSSMASTTTAAAAICAVYCDRGDDREGKKRGVRLPCPAGAGRRVAKKKGGYCAAAATAFVDGPNQIDVVGAAGITG